MPHNERVTTAFSVSADLAEVVNTDASWCFMILLNLVSNAFKATQLGSVTVSARLSAGHIRFTVADTGVGLSSSVEQNLWGAFKQSSRWASGTGLGLYHVHHLATALGGSVGYQPNILEGSGACFWADVPYVPLPVAQPLESSGATCAECHGRSHDGVGAGADDDRHASIECPTTSTGRGHSPSLLSGSATWASPLLPDSTVLLAEDNMFIQELTADLVRSAGIQNVVCACNGEDALTALTASDAPDFGLVLMDVQMPFMDGIECTRRVRAWERQAGRPKPLRILALSANGEDSACIRDCMAAGMDGVLSKPISRQTLCSLLGLSPSSPPSCTASSASTPLGSPAGSFHAKTLPSPPTAATAATAVSQAAQQAAGSGWEVKARIGRSDEAAAAAGASRSGTEPSHAAVFDLAALLHEHGEPRTRSLVAAFHAQGAQPLADLLVAMQRGDASATQRAAHTLKGLSAVVGAPALRAMAATIEQAAKAAAVDAGAAGAPPPVLEATQHAAKVEVEFERLTEAHRAFLASDQGGQVMGAIPSYSPDASNRC